MTEQRITYETAVLAKEKGFDIDALDYTTYYSIVDKKVYYNFEINNESPHKTENKFVLCSSQSLLKRWLREVYNIEFNIYKNRLTEKYRIVDSIINEETLDWGEEEFNSYELALEAALIEALKLIKV